MSIVKIWQTNSTDSVATEKLGERLGQRLQGGEVIELVSDLGGGKTTFVHGLAKGFGSIDKVASPSFTISKVYKRDLRKTSSNPDRIMSATNSSSFDVPLAIHHFDFYRLQLDLHQHSRKSNLLDLRKTPPSPDRILSATNSFSSLDVAKATSPSDKTVFARDNSLWERTILRKSSLDSGLMEYELQDILDDPKIVVVVEWGDVVRRVLPKNRLTIRITKTGENSRHFEFAYPESLYYLVENL